MLKTRNADRRPARPGPRLAITLALVLSAGLGIAPTSPAQAAPGGPAPLVMPTATRTAITTQPASATIGRYGTRTKATFSVKAVGKKLRYVWQSRPASGGSWKSIKGATSSKYTAKASVWSNGTRFRVVVSGSSGKRTSSTVTLTVQQPTSTPAADAKKAFGLTGLTQGVDLSAWQYTPAGKVNMSAIASWAGDDGFTILRNGSGSRPASVSYTDTCTGKSATTSSTPALRDCAYSTLADAASSRKLDLGHYWFNGWIDSIDTTSTDAFANGYTPAKAAKQYVSWLITHGNYTADSTDPLVLDIEDGSTWTKKVKGKKVTIKLRAWKPAEALEFLTTVKKTLTDKGYQANLYVYMGANNAATISKGSYVWVDVADVARLWVASWGTNNGRIPTSQPKVGPWATRGGWSIWQYTSNARIKGSNMGGLDGDIAKADAWTPR